MPMEDSDRTVALPPVVMFPVTLVAWMPSPEPVIVPLLSVILIAPLPPVLAEMPETLSPVVIVTVPVAEVFEALMPSAPPTTPVVATVILPVPLFVTATPVPLLPSIEPLRLKSNGAAVDAVACKPPVWPAMAPVF